MKVNILVNAPWGPTAYSNIARLFAPMVRDESHEVSQMAMWGLHGGPVEWDGMTVFPRHIDTLGRDIAGPHARNWNADVFFSWCDAFVVAPDTLGDLPWSPWLPVDADPVSPHLVPLLRKARWPLVYSRWGLERLQDVGIEHARYVPVGVDSDIFKEMNKAEARRKLNLPEDAFIVGMVAANISGDRKAYPQQMRAFADFKRKHKDAVLVIHAITNHLQGGVDLVAVCQSLGLQIGKDVYFSDQYAYNSGQMGPKELAVLYNTFDVLLSCTQAEGFGVPIVEAALCGIPSIVGDWSSMAELNFADLGHSANESTRIWNKFDTWWWLPNPAVITELLERAYTGEWENQRAALRNKALEYDARNVFRRFWKPLLMEMENEICGLSLSQGQSPPVLA